MGGRRVSVAAGALALAAVTLLALTSCVDQVHPKPISGEQFTSALGGSGAQRPNIVFVLTDDLSWNLVRYLPHVLALEKAGTTFPNYTVTDSLCCPSRSSILTGQFPHDTKVFTNGGIDGGFHVFHGRKEEKQTFATALQAAGYRTALMGKYLNGYDPNDAFDLNGRSVRNQQSPPQPTWVPPGWTSWDVAGYGYGEYNYDLNENHTVVHYGGAPSDYLTSVLGGLANSFVTSSANAHQPFLLELSTFTPHWPSIPAPQDERRFPKLRAPRSPAFDQIPRHAPKWLAAHPRLSAHDLAIIDFDYRRRVQDVLSIDRTIASLEQTLARTGQANNTVFVFSSDNGFHLGEHTLRSGKLTAFDTDVEVPLVIAGPRIPAGKSNRDVVQNIDLAATFEQIAGVRVPANVDGRSIVPLLLGASQPAWRTTALIEHHGLDFTPGDPDEQSLSQGNPPTYEAIRTAGFTYVRYHDGEREYYDLHRDKYQLDNTYRFLSPRRIAALNRQLAALKNCHGAAECWAAGLPSNKG